MILSGPCQSGLNDNYFDFPLDSKRRKFDTSWYYTDRTGCQTRDWLIYSPRSNRLFCYYCWLMCVSTNKCAVWGDIKIGISNFKKGIEKIRLNQESSIHR